MTTDLDDIEANHDPALAFVEPVVTAGATVPDVTRVALAFVETHDLPVPRLDVHLNGPGSLSIDPQKTGAGAEWVPSPRGVVSVHFIMSAPAFLAWARALGAVRVFADRSRTDSTHVTIRVWRDGISWGVVGYLPHEYGTPHLAGSDVTWDARSKHGVLTVDGLAAAYPAEVAP